MLLILGEGVKFFNAELDDGRAIRACGVIYGHIPFKHTSLKAPGDN